MSYVVYWMEEYERQVLGSSFYEKVPQAMEFSDDQLTDALKCAEQLRQQKYAGRKIFFITLCGEDPNCVGKMGVDVTGPDYDWKKRR